MNQRRWFTFSLLLLFCLFCAGKNQKQESSYADFTLKSLDGEEYTLSKLRGRVVIVDFWATWCPPCRREIPHLVEIYNKYKDNGLIILGISNEDAGTLETFRDAYHISYPILFGSNEVFQRFGVSSIPHTLFINKNGKIRKTQIGFADELVPIFEALIDTLIHE
ncbi:MAG: peroxiredoxin family protein [bacterium]